MEIANIDKSITQTDIDSQLESDYAPTGQMADEIYRIKLVRDIETIKLEGKKLDVELAKLTSIELLEAQNKNLELQIALKKLDYTLINRQSKFEEKKLESVIQANREEVLPVYSRAIKSINVPVIIDKFLDGKNVDVYVDDDNQRWFNSRQLSEYVFGNISKMGINKLQPNLKRTIKWNNAMNKKVNTIFLLDEGVYEYLLSSPRLIAREFREIIREELTKAHTCNQ